MSDQGWNNPGSSPQDPQGGWGTPPGGGQGQAPPPPQQGGWSQAPPPPQQGGGTPPSWGQQPPPPQHDPSGGQSAPQGGWGQPPAQQQPGQWGQQPQQWGGGQQPGGSSGIDPKIAGILAYVPFGGLGGLVIYLVNKDPLSRFHGAQSLLLMIAWMAIWIASTILSIILPDVIALILSFGLLVLWFIYFVASIYLAVQAYNLKKVTLPVVGPIAETWATK